MKHNVHLICNAHLDPVWQWRWTEGCSEALMTFRTAVQILEEYPELIFNHNEAILYQWVREYDPPLFTRIRQLVDQGRWFISGGWFLQPDLNLPPVENLVRNIRMGQEFFLEHFGSIPKVAYNFDSFGHPATLPGILLDHGYEMYIHQRPEKEFLDLPASLYNWKGTDGRMITGYRIEIGLYHNERHNIAGRLREGADLAIRLGRDVALFWGLGDHGGGATRHDLNQIREYTASDDRVAFVHSTPDRYLEAIRPLIPTLPVKEGSLQRVFAGCYTSLSRIKRKALEASAAALQSESLSHHLPQPETPNLAPDTFNLIPDTYRDIWRDILFNDFHDILPGTCTAPAEQDALELYGRALENIRRLNLGLVSRINRAAPPLQAHIPVTLFQSVPELEQVPVEFECMSDYRPLWEGEWVLRLFDRLGNEVPCQEEQPEARLPFHRWRRKISFIARGIPAGVHHYELRLSSLAADGRPQTADHRPPPAVREAQLCFLALHDRADSWGTGTGAWREVAGRFEPEGQPERLIEQGPVRELYEQKLAFNRSRILVQRISYPGWPVTEYKIRIHWNEERLRLKLAIPVKMENPVLTAEIPGGEEVYNADGQEYVHGRWIRVEDADGKKKLHLAHNGLHGFDFDGREVRLSVLRSAVYCHEQGDPLLTGPEPRYMDQGVHEIRLAVWEDPSIRPDPVARWLIAPPLVWPHLPIGDAIADQDLFAG
ncbi:MAG: hypothetical protein R6V75_12115 [Bacteroidales bacterium]